MSYSIKVWCPICEADTTHRVYLGRKATHWEPEEPPEEECQECGQVNEADWDRVMDEIEVREGRE